jgi:predicted permease
MARRKFKAKPRSRSKPKLNLIDTGVSLLIANSVSNNVTGLNLRDFLFAGTSLSSTDERGFNSTNRNWNNNVTLMEIFGGSQLNASQGRTETPGQQLIMNAKANAVPLAMAVIGIPLIAKVSKKFLRAPILTPVNKMLKMSGLGVKV